jgi:hypothetical protein
VTVRHPDAELLAQPAGIGDKRGMCHVAATPLALGIALILLAGCSLVVGQDEVPACVSAADCPNGGPCVEGACALAAVDAGGGAPRDPDFGGPVDASPPPADATGLPADADALRVDVGPPADAARSLPDAAPPIDAAPPPIDAAPPPIDAQVCFPEPETCDGTDEDCDGRVDEDAPCGAYVQDHCAIILGWSDVGDFGTDVRDAWAACPRTLKDDEGEGRCNTTRGDGRFRRVTIPGDANGSDHVGVAFRCDDDGRPGLAAWFETHCAVFLGWADNGRAPPDGPTWGDCPDALTGGGDLRCTSSGFDRRFRPMRLAGDVDDNDDFAVAFLCRDDAQPERAATVAGQVEVRFGWAEGFAIPADGAAQWLSVCPGLGVALRAVDGR